MGSLKHIFNYEWEVLRKGKLIYPLEDERSLMNKYNELLLNYEKLLKVSQRIFKISDMQGSVLKKRETDIRNIMDNVNQGFLTFGPDLKVDKEYSRACIEMLGGQMANQNILDLLWTCEEKKKGNQQKLVRILETKDQSYRDELLRELSDVISLSNRSIQLEFKVISSFENDEEVEIFMLMMMDITERLQAEAKAYYLSYHDSLTGIYNRAYLEKLIPDIMQDDYLPLSLIMADMNGLKITNDTYGHLAGDQLIQSTAEALLQCTREQDIVVRWGGDEFLILLPHMDRAGCQKIIQSIASQCKKIKDCPIEVSLSLGSASCDKGTFKSLDELFREAEQEMYCNKRGSKEILKFNF